MDQSDLIMGDDSSCLALLVGLALLLLLLVEVGLLLVIHLLSEDLVV